jgi:hypothetical protein
VLRVSYEDLDYDGAVSTFEGKPFTGVAFEEDEDGSLAEDQFAEGLASGLSRKWSLQRQLIEERQLLGGALHGTVREWSTHGLLLRHATYESGICLTDRRWNEAGELINDYQLPADHPYQNTLKLMRGMKRRAESGES